MTDEEVFGLAAKHEELRMERWREWLEIIDRLAKEYGSRRGWKLSGKSFSVGQLSRGSSQTKRGEFPYPQRPFDHSYFYRSTSKPYRPVAIATHPYLSSTAWEEFKGLEKEHQNLSVEKIDDFPSWWFPGSTTFVLVRNPWVV